MIPSDIRLQFICFIEVWDDASVSVLCRSYSDHCPILLKSGLPNLVLKPLKIFDKWIGDPDLADTISNSWASPQDPLSSDLIFKNKLKKLWNDIKNWTRSRIASQSTVRDELKFKDDLKQKSRLKWAIEGDENTKIFRSMLKNKFATCSIKGIHVNGVWCDSPDRIKEAALVHFSSMFKENIHDRPHFSIPMFRRLSSSDGSSLEAGIFLEEIQDAVCLIGCVYKVISKILASRLSKVDFEKAFDSVSWSFLQDVMLQMGFVSKWRNWIQAFLSSATISVLINGSPSNEFKMERGLRQGDPLSSFLFLLVAEALQNSILEACLKINMGKSRLIGIGVATDDVVSVASSLGCSHDSIPFIYLGLPVGKRMNLCDRWDIVINHSRERLSSWKANSLSIGGRLTLVKSVLGTLPVFLLSLFKALVKVINLLEASRCRFFWGFKDSQRGIFFLDFTLSKWIKTARAIDDLSSLVSLIGNLAHSNNGMDKWVWNINAFGKFKRDSLNRLDTRVNLALRGVKLPCRLCPFYERSEEVIDHFLVRCLFVLPVWWKIWSWWNLPQPLVFSSFYISDIVLGSCLELLLTKISAFQRQSINTLHIVSPLIGFLIRNAIAISYNHVQHLRTKHIDVRYHFIKEHVKNGTIEIYFVTTSYQLSITPERLKRLAESEEA
nr:hypothetical protein [Tanacetum cinerariifolium]